jgi:hypothetical protein
LAFYPQIALYGDAGYACHAKRGLFQSTSMFWNSLIMNDAWWVLRGRYGGWPTILNILFRISGPGRTRKRSAFASVMRPSLDAWGAPTKPCIAWPPCTAWFCPIEGVAEDQTEGDVDAPQVRTYRPECSVRSEGSATLLPRLPPSYCYWLIWEKGLRRWRDEASSCSAG